MGEKQRRYLEWKQTVDERALNRRVRRQLLENLPDRPTIFEAGCGTGVSVPRLFDWGIRPSSYVGVDRDADIVAYARQQRPLDLRKMGYEVTDTERGCTVDECHIAFRQGEALSLARDQPGQADLVIAQSFMDLVPIDEAVSAFEEHLRPGGLAYFPLTFDGETIFQPDHPADEAVMHAYHADMDADSHRNSTAGRILASLLTHREGSLLAMGSSDWIVRPTDDGYPGAEQLFLETILEFVEHAVADTAVTSEEWLETRRQQLAESALTYVAHQYDLLYQTPE